jgi:hypothetical protein
MPEKTELKVGDTVYGDFGRYPRVDVREGKVVKVTPTGRINADFGQRCDGNGERIIYQFKDGRQVGSHSRWHSYWLIDRKCYLERLELQRKEGAVNAFRVHANKAPRGDKAAMLAWVEEMKALAEAIPDSYTT